FECAHEAKHQINGGGSLTNKLNITDNGIKTRTDKYTAAAPFYLTEILNEVSGFIPDHGLALICGNASENIDITLRLQIRSLSVDNHQTSRTGQLQALRNDIIARCEVNLLYRFHLCYFAETRTYIISRKEINY